MGVVQFCVRRESVGTQPDVLRGRGGARLTRVVALLAAAAVGLSACSSGSTDAAGAAGATGAPGASATAAPSGTPSPSSTTSGVQGPPGPQDAASTSATVSPPLPNPVRSVAKVKRPGAPATPTVSAPVAAFSAAVAYPDGLRLRITKATKGVEQGHGPGVFAGREFVLLSLELTNGTTKAVDLNQVVVTTTYGSSRQLAAPVYTEGAGARDFSGVVAPGTSATAAFAFAVPVAQLGDVTTVVDFDGVHTSATYHGAVNAS